MYRALLVGLIVGVSAVTGQAQAPASAPAAPAPAAAGGRPSAAPGAGGNFASNFTGKITVGETKEMRTSRIRFEAGARTVWHVHDTPQLLLIEEGRGRLQELGSAVR